MVSGHNSSSALEAFEGFGAVLASAIRDAVRDELRGVKELANDEPNEWMDCSRAATYLGMHEVTLRKLTASRKIPFHQDRPRARLWFSRAELDAWRRGETR